MEKARDWVWHYVSRLSSLWAADLEWTHSLGRALASGMCTYFIPRTSELMTASGYDRFEIALMIAPPERQPPPGNERKTSAEVPQVFSEDFARFRRRSSVGHPQAMSPSLAPLHEHDSSPESHDDDRRF